MHRKHTTIASGLLLAWVALLISLVFPGTGTTAVAAYPGEARRDDPALQATSPATSPAPRVTPSATALPVFPVVTSTPGPDGSVAHQVEPGQTLIGIAEAYGLTINELLTLNGLLPDAVIFPGNKLVIVPAVTPSITPTGTNTARPTGTATATRRPPTATPTQTLVPTPAPTATATPWLRMPAVDFDARSTGMILIVVCAIGLVVVGLTAFRSK
jgi:LysM repeat protein